MISVIFILSYFGACFKWGAWKRWKEFYPTILYVIIGDITYNMIFYNRLLWTYESGIGHTLYDLLIAFLIFPCAVILFLSHYPHKWFAQAAYIAAWTAVHTLIEFISFSLGAMSYAFGWNIFWSGALYAIAFVLIRVHHKHPLVVWPISCAFAVATMVLFCLPLTQIK